MGDQTSFVARLDELEKKVETAAALINNLRAENQKLKQLLAEKVKEINTLQTHLTSQSSSVMSGGDSSRLAEFEAREKEYQEWLEKRDEIKRRLESVMTRLARMEEVSSEQATEEGNGEETQ